MTFENIFHLCAFAMLASVVLPENDLNIEIDRLVQLSSEQKRKLAEAECRKYSEQYEVSRDVSPEVMRLNTFERNRN